MVEGLGAQFRTEMWHASHPPFLSMLEKRDCWREEGQQERLPFKVGSTTTA